MKQLPLNANTSMPAIGFGTYLIAPQDTAQAVQSAIALGYRHIDTAAVYENEQEVGAGIRAALHDTGLRREDIFVTTKLWPGYAEHSPDADVISQTIEEFDASLARLGMSYVDLYLIHSPLSKAERLDQWRALLQIKQAGKARSVGVSNFSRKHLEEIQEAGLALPDANQVELHPWSQKTELLAFMQAHSIAPIAYSSLAPLSSWRSQPGQDSAKTQAMKADDGVFAEMAARYGVSEAQLLLRWANQNGYAVLPKSLNAERMKQNQDLESFTISDADMAYIRTLDRGAGIAWSMGDPSLAD